MQMHTPVPPGLVTRPFRSVRLAGWCVAALLAACGGEQAPVERVQPVLVTRPDAAAPTAAALPGEIRAREESTLSFQVAGRMVERRVDMGDHVARGQVLATLDPDDLQARVRAARARLAAAEAELGRARADQARFATLAGDQLVSRSAVDAQDAAATAAQGQVDAARAELEVAGNQAGYGALRAPADGVIVARTAEAGQVVGAGQAVFVLAADGAREVAFAVAEGRAGGIAPGQPVEVALWTRAGERWPGTVREVAPDADPASRTFSVRATVEAPDGVLELGQSARVYLPAEAGTTLSVPLSALQRDDNDPGAGDGDGAAVFVVDPSDMTLRLQPVVIGPYGSDRVPVRSGLSADAWVVAAGGHLLREGLRVRPVDRDNRALAGAGAGAGDPGTPAAPAPR